VVNQTLVPIDGKGLDWPRKVSNATTNAANRLKVLEVQASGFATNISALQTQAATKVQFPFEMLSAAPASPAEGRTYYDTTLHKVRTWDGSAWQNYW
jgi:hypothetical protein